MAEGLFNHLAGPSSGMVASSAGVAAIPCQSPSDFSVQALAEMGLDICDIQSRRINSYIVEESDCIVGMTRGHLEAVLSMFPHAKGKLFLLGQFQPGLDELSQEIADPIGGSYEVYQACRDEIYAGVKSLIKYMEETKQEEARVGSQGRITLAIGSDHAGFELKTKIVHWLQGLGHGLIDAGTDKAESTDYPDFARKVADQVAQGQADFGILVCSSGIGMSMAANKVSGVRAALAINKEMAELARGHNDANVLCIGSKYTDETHALEMIETFLGTSFDGGRHERRLGKMKAANLLVPVYLRETDPAIAGLIDQERKRQQDHLELIASENFTSPAVMAAQGSVLTNKYAEGYPGKRWYGGCEFVDEVETLAIERAKKLFGAEHANVQPHSGSGANMAVYFAFLKPGDRMLTMDLSHGGHLTHGNKANFSGKFFEIIHYGVREEDELIDYDQLAEMAREDRPQMITVGASAYPRIIDFERMAAIAREVDALLLADIAHIAGMVATGVHPSPVGHADFVTTTTHKTLRGPRGGLILCGEEYAKQIDSQTFPGIQGGPLMHVIAGKAVCFHEALQPEFKTYQQQVVKNAKALADGLLRNGFRLVSGGTDNHLLLVDVGARDLTGKDCQLALDLAGITANKNTIPFETRSPFKASGVRLGSPAVTTRGMKEKEMLAIADMISEVLFDIKNIDGIEKVRERVKELTARFPLPY